MTSPQEAGKRNVYNSTRSYYNQTYTSNVAQENAWSNIFGTLGWLSGKVGMASTVVTWILLTKEETNEIAYNERLQFIAGAKIELKRLYVLKGIWEDNEFNEDGRFSFVEFLTNQITKLESEIETNEKLDSKEIEHIKAVCRQNGYYGEFSDWRSSEPIFEGHVVNYWKIYNNWNGYDD
ncbi:MAG: hypothetical protein IJL80_15885 [Treponema sp.]|nr:hypothetical protein [Treponema sp.]